MDGFPVSKETCSGSIILFGFWFGRLVSEQAEDPTRSPLGEFALVRSVLERKGHF